MDDISFSQPNRTRVSVGANSSYKTVCLLLPKVRNSNCVSSQEMRLSTVCSRITQSAVAIRESSELLEAWNATELKFQCVRCNLFISVRKIQACGKWDLCFECPSQMDADTSMGPFFNGERIGNHRNGTPREMAEVQMIYHGGKASML